MCVCVRVFEIVSTLVSQVVASKYLNDEGESEALTNSEWAEVGCKGKPALDLMERRFLAAIVRSLSLSFFFLCSPILPQYLFLSPSFRLYIVHVPPSSENLFMCLVSISIPSFGRSFHTLTTIHGV